MNDSFEKAPITLEDIANQLVNNCIVDNRIKVQLIYAFNSTGKTRLLRKIVESVDKKADSSGFLEREVLYYNAFTEDLFYWDNGLKPDSSPRLKIQKNEFIDWILQNNGDKGIIENFQRYTDEKLTPKFIESDILKNGKKTGYKTYSEVSFSYKRGDDTDSGNIKISRGEESIFIWSLFYTFLSETIDNFNESIEKSTNQSNVPKYEYILIDDPVSSLDENNLIELAVNLAELIKNAPKKLKFIIATHNPLFYNILHNEMDKKKERKTYFLNKCKDGTYNLDDKYGDSNRCFSYHLHLIKIIKEAIENKQIEKFHFMLLRNLYEKTASFLGYEKWADLLPEDKNLPVNKRGYLKRIINFTSHRTLSNEEVSEPTEPEKKTVAFLLDSLIENYCYYKKEKD